MDNIDSLITQLRAETMPETGHTDPQAIQRTWDELSTEIFKLKKKLQEAEYRKDEAEKGIKNYEDAMGLIYRGAEKIKEITELSYY